MKLNLEKDSLVLPVIIMRHGGLDGVALQKNEYANLLKNFDMNTHIISGVDEAQFSGNEIDHDKQTVIDRLDFQHKDTQLLYANEFYCGPETDEYEKVSEEVWLATFYHHKNEIKNQIKKVLDNISVNSPVIVFNLISLRHAHPAAAVAIHELMEEYPERGFISHSADPDAERPEKISRLKKFVLPLISANSPDKPYSGGPYFANNLYHIVLNPRQHKNFIERYKIPQEHIFEIPDFLNFEVNVPVPKLAPDPEFMECLFKNRVFADGDSYKYWGSQMDKNTVFFFSPVRPVYRKRLKEAMLVAYYYGKSRGKKVAFVVTHPDKDDNQYFLESVKFANGMELPFYHLGRDFTIESMDSIYINMAALQSVGVVASSAGGWENALNEMAEAYIPFFMSSSLNSFIPLTETIKIITHGMDFSGAEEIIKSSLLTDLRIIDLALVEEITETCNWIDNVLYGDYREKIIENNYRQAFRHLSHEATALKLMKIIFIIFQRHGVPRTK